MVRTFANGVGDGVPYRVGYVGGGSSGAGFGQSKVIGKHKITNDEIVGAVVRSPGKTQQQGNLWVHEKEARLVSLFGDDERLTVRVVINYGSWLGEGRQGVVTAYCIGYNPECPEWVNTAFAID